MENSRLMWKLIWFFFVVGLLPWTPWNIQARILGKDPTFVPKLMSVTRVVSYELSYDAYHRSLWQYGGEDTHV